MTIERAGLGYSLLVAKQGVGLNIDRLVENRGELTGELTVAQAPKGHVFKGRFNLSSLTARKSTAGWLQSQAPLNGKGPPWPEVLEQFCVAVLDAEREGPGVVTIGVDRPRERPAFLIDPFLLDGPVATILYGDGGSGKSTLAAAAAVAVASGVTTFPAWTVVRSAPVLVLDYETSADDWNDTISAVASGIGIERPQMGYLRCDRSLPSIVNEVARLVSERKVGLVIIDSAERAMPSMGEGAGAAEGALRLFKAMRLLAVPCLVIDHKAKNDDRGPYGSVYKWNSARAVWELRAGEAADDGSVSLALVHRKANLTRRFKPVAYRLTRGEGSILMSPEVFIDGSDLAEKAQTIPQRLERALTAATRALNIAELAEELGISEKSVAVNLNRHKDTMFVRVMVVGRRQFWAARAQHGQTTVGQHQDGVVIPLHAQDPPDTTHNTTQHNTSPPVVSGGYRGNGGSEATDLDSSTGGVVFDSPSKGPFDSLAEANESRTEDE